MLFRTSKDNPPLSRRIQSQSRGMPMTWRKWDTHSPSRDLLIRMRTWDITSALQCPCVTQGVAVPMPTCNPEPTCHPMHHTAHVSCIATHTSPHHNAQLSQYPGYCSSHSCGTQMHIASSRKARAGKAHKIKAIEATHLPH